MTDKDFLEVLKKLLYPLNDAHVYVKANIGCLNSGEDNVIADIFSLDAVCEKYIENPKKCGNKIITYGRLKSDSQIGYIHIAAFSSGQTGINQKQNWADDIDFVLEELRDTKSIILDVRGNRGGLTGNVSRISGRFCVQNKTYAISRTKNGSVKNDFGAAVELEIKKNGNWQYTKPVILLTNAQTMSAGEEFTMALVSQSHVTQVGNHTCGVFSLSLERAMVNGWKYSVSVQKVTDPEGNIPEGKGIVPAAENLILNPSVSQDLQFERAMELCK
jgi:C-terminal processing protease CtpA/Prc